MWMVLTAFYFHARCRQGAARNFLSSDCPATDRQSTQLGFDAIEIAAGVDQRAQNHVAADAGKTVEVGKLHFGQKESLLLLTVGFKSRGSRSSILFAPLLNGQRATAKTMLERRCAFGVILKSEGIVEAQVAPDLRRNCFDERQMIAIQLVG